MIRGRGGAFGPDLSNIGRKRTIRELEQALLRPGMPPVPGYQPVSVRLRNGTSLSGVARNRSNFDLQLQDRQGRLHLLTRAEIAEVTEGTRSQMPPLNASADEKQNLLAYLSSLVESREANGPPITGVSEFGPGDWPTYHGRVSGNRHSQLDQINTGNVGRLAPKWIFSIPNSRRLEVTPVVVDGVMYVTAANEAYALDARTGRRIWHYQRPLTKGVIGDAAGAINRGVAVLGDRLFMVTDNAHLLALSRATGGLIWDVEMADYRQHYGATSAPLVVKDLVLSGTSGGDEGVRGFVAAYKASTGERVWRFWSIPAPGEPLAKTWIGKALEHGCGATWLTGTYDPSTDLIYWPTGNPCPDYNGDERKGDNLYADSVLALEAETGKLRWYYQFTPHDLHDWDATQTPMLVDADFGGKNRKLMLQANSNGFFYVLDRTTGELLLAKPFVKKLNWASGVGTDGRPAVNPAAIPTSGGVRVCPAVEGATNWMSTGYNPQTGFFYVMALEKCQIFTKFPEVWQPGKSYYGGGTRDLPDDPGKKILRAIDIRTGKIAWEYPQEGDAKSWGGVLSTSSGLVFVCDDSGALAALDAKTGELLWHFQTSQLWKASPMTFMVDGKQYVAVAAGSNILAFGL